MIENITINTNIEFVTIMGAFLTGTGDSYDWEDRYNRPFSLDDDVERLLRFGAKSSNEWNLIHYNGDRAINREIFILTRQNIEKLLPSITFECEHVKEAKGMVIDIVENHGWDYDEDLQYIKLIGTNLVFYFK